MEPPSITIYSILSYVWFLTLDMHSARVFELFNVAVIIEINGLEINYPVLKYFI